MAEVAVTEVANILVNSLHISELEPPLTGSKGSMKNAGQPDIDYHPDEVKWKARTARRLAEDPSLPSTPLPSGFPTHLESPLVWKGSDWKEEKEWVYELSSDHLQELENALRHFQSKCNISSSPHVLNNHPLDRLEQTYGPHLSINVPLAYLGRCTHLARERTTHRPRFLCSSHHPHIVLLP